MGFRVVFFRSGRGREPRRNRIGRATSVAHGRCGQQALKFPSIFNRFYCICLVTRDGGVDGRGAFKKPPKSSKSVKYHPLFRQIRGAFYYFGVFGWFLISLGKVVGPGETESVARRRRAGGAAGRLAGRRLSIHRFDPDFLGTSRTPRTHQPFSPTFGPSSLCGVRIIIIIILNK